VSTPTPFPVPTNLEQQHKLAKDLLHAARAGDASALARVQAVRSDSGSSSRPLQLADAQLAIAREGGFDSWPKLVADFHERDVEAFCEAVRAGDAARAKQLLAAAHVRQRLDDPMFDFGQRAAHIAAAKNEALLAVLLDAGADANSKSDWENGPFTVLDRADEATARFLLARGALLTPNVAARLGWLDELRRLVEADPALVHARGGDGQQPLHEAKTVDIADFLLDRGAGIDVRCIDHKTTPAQYALVDRPEVCRRLLERGATPDIYMAARLGDVALATRLLDADPGCASARIHEPGYAPVPPLHIYCWTLGFGRSPHEIANRFGHTAVGELLTSRSPGRVRFLNALMSGNERAARAELDADPSLLSSLGPEDHGRLAVTIFYEHFAAADVMLSLGFDPAAPGIDGGTALHAACWVGNVRMVERLIERGGVGLDARDPTHQSTPLGWTAFGSVHRRARGADYPAVAERLVAAGADITAVGNGEGRSLTQMAEGNGAMQQALRNLGAR
jgi:ankyrin repeat protein